MHHFTESPTRETVLMKQTSKHDFEQRETSSQAYQWLYPNKQLKCICKLFSNMHITMQNSLFINLRYCCCKPVAESRLGTAAHTAIFHRFPTR